VSDIEGPRRTGIRHRCDVRLSPRSPCASAVGVVRLPACSGDCLVRSDDEETNLVPFSGVGMGGCGCVGIEYSIARNDAVYF
jgi:hypothetical protein